ncbi:MAG: hypothetical protein JRG80_17010, partial [Deltaproteobacteria bacterium]|nr:hypothetical protein [Deltaproteobacteria bacterium]
PFTMMFSNCNNVHDVMTEWELRSYREHFPLFPVIYTHKGEEQLCSYIPVMYLDYLLGVMGGLYLGLRKQFHPGMKDIETDTSKSFVIKDTLDVSFSKDSASGGRELDPFFVTTFENRTRSVLRDDVRESGGDHFVYRKDLLLLDDCDSFESPGHVT